MTPEEAKQNMNAIVNRTIEAVGGGEWSVEESGATECVMPSGKAGVQFDVQRFGPGAADVGSALRLVEKLWSREGITFERTMLGKSLAKQLTHMTDAAGFFIEFSVNENSMSLWAFSACALGDADDVNPPL